MKKFRVLFLAIIFVVGCFGTALAKEPTYEKMSQFIDDFMLGSILKTDILQKYHLISTSSIGENLSKLIIKTEQRPINKGWDEITLVIDDTRKILNVSIRFFTDAKIGQELNDYCDTCFPAVTEKYGLPNLEGVAGFVRHPSFDQLEPKGPIKSYWLNNNDNYRYFYGCYQRPRYVEGYGFSGSLITGSRGILFIAQLTGYYDDNTIIPVARYGELPLPKAYNP